MKKILVTTWFHLIQVLQHSIQPPVIASILGMIISSITPIRGLFVDVYPYSNNNTSNTHHHHPLPSLSWFFDGLYGIGQAAVPINMMILGMNVSASFFDKKKKYISSSFFHPEIESILTTHEQQHSTMYPQEERMLPLKDGSLESVSNLSSITILLAVLGKMLCMPMIGILSTFIFYKLFGHSIPPGTFILAFYTCEYLYIYMYLNLIY